MVVSGPVPCGAQLVGETSATSVPWGVSRLLGRGAGWAVRARVSTCLHPKLPAELDRGRPGTAWLRMPGACGLMAGGWVPGSPGPVLGLLGCVRRMKPEGAVLSRGHTAPAPRPTRERPGPAVGPTSSEALGTCAEAAGKEPNLGSSPCVCAAARPPAGICRKGENVEESCFPSA